MSENTDLKPQFFKKEKVVAGITWILRILVGAIFVFSGFTKGIDPWGTIFKFNEYFSIWGWEIGYELSVAGVFILCIAEFLIGFCLLFGCFRRTTPIIALLLMAFMLPLTLWLAIKNPISDCGCFGDAFVIGNWETFFKNVFLTAGCVWLAMYNKAARCLIHPYLQWIAITATGLFILVVALIGYLYQPLMDFRPYKNGTPLIEDEAIPDENYDEDAQLRFVYEKNGVRREFGIDDTLPEEEDGWNFVERYYVETDSQAFIPVATPKATQNDKNFRIFSEDGHDDLTEEMIGSGPQIILMMPEIGNVSAASTWKINALYYWCAAHGIDMLATAGGNPSEIEKWKDISLAEYPVYTSDDTSIEEVVRGNPGVVYLEDGIIRWKRSLKSIDADSLTEEASSTEPSDFAVDNNGILLNIIWIFIAVLALLLLISTFPFLLEKLMRKPLDTKKPANITTQKSDKDEETNAG